MPVKLSSESETDSSEETSSEDTQNNQPDTENDDTSTEHSEDTESSKEVDPEADLKKYFSVDDLPAEVKEIGKKMLATHTKSMQKIKSDKENIEKELGTQYSDAILKARSLEALAKNPDFQLLIADLETGRPYGYSSNFNRGNGNEKPKEEENSEDGEITPSKINAMVDAAINKALKPIRDENTKKQFEVVKALPFFEKNRPRITELINDFGMPLDRAYELATEKDRALEKAKLEVDTAKTDVEKLRKKPRTEQPSNNRSDSLSKRTINNVRDAISHAMEISEKT